MPIVRKSIEEIMGTKDKNAIGIFDSQHSVANGASARAHDLLCHEDKKLELKLDSSVGIGIEGGYFKKILEKDSILPVSSSCELTLNRHFQNIFVDHGRS